MVTLFNEKLETAIRKAFRIYKSELPWKTKCGLIFSDDVSDIIFGEFGYSGYFDPDMGYSDDVIAFMNWLEEKLGNEAVNYGA